MIKKNLDNMKKRMKERNLDWVWVNVGEEGSGKSSFSIQLAQAFDEDFDESQICFNAKDYMRTAKDLDPYSVIILDEGIESLFSRNAMTKENKKFIQFFRQCRELNLFHIINIPSLSELEKGIRQNRAKTISKCLPGKYKADIYGRNDLDNIQVKNDGSVSWGSPSFRQGWKDPQEDSEQVWDAYQEKKDDRIDELVEFDEEEEDDLSSYLSTGQVADKLDVSGATVRRWCDSGDLDAKKLPNGDRRIPREEVEKVIS